MSDAIYPVLPGALPDVTRTPIWSTTTKTAMSGREFRSANWSTPIYAYKLGYEVLRQNLGLTEMETLAGFFNARRGSFDSFLFSDPDDNTATAQAFGVGNGGATAFQLLRTWGGYTEPVYEVPGSIGVQMNGGLGGIGSFERDTNADGLSDGWQLFVGGAGDGARTYTKSRVPTGSAKHGTAVQFFQISAVGNANDSGLTVLTRTPVLPGQQYTLAASIRCSVSGKAYLTGRVYDAASASVGDFSTSTVAATGALVDKAVTFTAPANAATIEIAVRGITAVSEFIEVDAVQLWPGATAPAVTSTQVALLEGPDYTRSSTGLLTLAVAPAVTAALSWTGSFYRRVKFLHDSADFQKFLHQLWSLKTVDLRGVKP